MRLRFASLLPLAVFWPVAAGPEATPLFHEPFDDARLTARGWYDGDKYEIVGGAHKGPGCIEEHWRAGATIPDSTSPLRHLFEPTDSVYVRFWIRLQRGWGWSGRGYHPHLINILTTENDKYRGPASSHLTLYVEPQAGHLRLATQDIQNKDAPHGPTQGPLMGGYNGRFYDSKETLFTDDKWHSVEAYFKLNTLGPDKPNADGELRGWFDGKLVIDRSDIVFRSRDFPNMKFNQLLLAPYFGEGLLPHEQTLWIDEMTVARRRMTDDG